MDYSATATNPGSQRVPTHANMTHQQTPPPPPPMPVDIQYGPPVFALNPGHVPPSFIPVPLNDYRSCGFVWPPSAQAQSLPQPSPPERGGWALNAPEPGLNAKVTSPGFFVTGPLNNSAAPQNISSGTSPGVKPIPVIPTPGDGMAQSTAKPVPVTVNTSLTNAKPTSPTAMPSILTPLSKASSDLPKELALARLLKPSDDNQMGAAPPPPPYRVSNSPALSEATSSPAAAYRIPEATASPALIPPPLHQVNQSPVHTGQSMLPAVYQPSPVMHQNEPMYPNLQQQQQHGPGMVAYAGLPVPLMGAAPGHMMPVASRPRRRSLKEKTEYRSWLEQNKLYQDRLYARGFRILEGSNGTKVCSMCHQQFSKEMFVWRHALQHIAQKPFHCTTCDQRFTRGDTLQRHVRRSGHNGPAGGH